MSSQSLFGGGHDLRGTTGILILAASVCVLAAGIGAATSYLKGPAAKASSPRSGSSDDSLARLKDYTRSIGGEDHAPKAAEGKLLPDVNTMVDRLAARLESAPGDGKGWRTLGWSYFHMARYKEAANAYAKAVELDPSRRRQSAVGATSGKSCRGRQGCYRTEQRAGVCYSSHACARS